MRPPKNYDKYICIADGVYNTSEGCVGPLTTAEDEDFGLVFPSTGVRMIPLDTSWYKILKLPS